MGEFPNTETQFKKGEGGRPKGSKNRSTVVREMIEAAASDHLHKMMQKNGMIPPESLDKPATVVEQLVSAMIASSSSGDVKAFTALMDSAYGKLTDKVNTTHTFKRMGKVEVVPVSDGSGNVTGAPAPVALTFNVGEDASQPENDIEEGEDDE